jgi:PHP family Zn ribbon phosphoesterase
MNLEGMSKGAKMKGLNLVGTSDFTFKLWLNELKKKLEPLEGTGLFRYRDVYFMLTSEVGTVYQQEGKKRDIHHLIHAPSFEIVEQINESLSKYGNLESDGRPILTLTSPELVEILMGISKNILITSSHIWTPWKSLFGSKFGFDSVEECYQDQTRHIFSLETGLSSTPDMNWRLSSLDRFTLVSNSDSHSPWSWRLGREANVFDLKKLTYWEIFDTIKKKDKKRFLYTIEVDPRYGKYHNNGHRLCNINLTPAETKKLQGICPKCVKGDTIILGDNKPISQINAGNNYIGMNSCGKIKRVFARNYEGKIIQINACGLLPIEVTPEHPVLVTTSRTKDFVIHGFSELYWKEARKIVPKHGHKDGDYLIVPRINGTVNIKKVDLNSFTTKHGAKIAKGKNLPLSFPLNENTAWLLGLYVAEGSCRVRRDKNGFDAGGVVFSLGKHEKKIQNTVCKIIKSLGYSPCIVKREYVTEIIVSSMILNRAFSAWCGKGALNKKVPDFILLHKDLSLIKAFLDGYIAGDGCSYRGAVWAESVSQLLALQLQILCARLGKFLHINSKPPRRERFQGRKVNRHKSYAMYYNIDDTQFQVKIFDTFIITPIREVNVTFHKGKVYNIETNDNTYLVSNAVVHNCRKKLTLGVLHRVEKLADRPEGFVPKNAIPFKTLLPLYEIISFVTGVNQLYSQKVIQEQNKLIREFGNELNILLNVPREELTKVTNKKIADAIIKVREGRVKYIPGYDGVYGNSMKKSLKNSKKKR